MVHFPLPNGVSSALVTTGWIFDTSLCENSIYQKISLKSNLNASNKGHSTYEKIGKLPHLPLPDGVSSALVTTGWIFDTSLRDNSIYQKISLKTNLNASIRLKGILDLIKKMECWLEFFPNFTNSTFLNLEVDEHL